MTSPLLTVRGVKTYYGNILALKGVDVDVADGEIVTLIGANGAGKSTLMMTIFGNPRAREGSIVFDGRDITKLSRSDMRPIRREMMMIFQDPYASLNARKRVGFIVAEALEVHKMGTAAEIKRRVQELLEVVGLNPEHYNRFPHEFSGGQRQRIGVARALALKPKLIIADEPVSALDVSIQSQILNLLKDLQNEFDLTYLFIAHDLGVVRHVSDRIAVMYLGKMVELSPAEELYQRPIMPYTEALLSAVPIPDPDLAAARERIVLTGDVPSPIDPPPGCGFHPRCRYMTDVCREIEPPLTGYDGHLAACHHPLNVSKDDALRAGVAAENPESAPADATPTEPAGRESHPVSAETPRSG